MSNSCVVKIGDKVRVAYDRSISGEVVYTRWDSHYHSWEITLRLLGSDKRVEISMCDLEWIDVFTALGIR